ncbi:hypothetical protein [Ferruginibacter sp.]
MAKIKVALGRFYNAKFCTIEKAKEIIWTLDFRDIEIMCRLGNGTSLNTYVFHDENEKLANTSSEKYPAELYFEVIAYKLIDVNDVIASELSNHNLEAREKVYKEILVHEESLISALNYAAGMLGLRLSPELVKLPIFDIEHKYVFISNKLFSLESSLAIQVKKDINFLAPGKEKLSLKMESLKLEDKDPLKKSIECLTWFLRAWGTEDYVLKFVSFFTALEPIIPLFDREEKKKYKIAKAKLLEMLKSQEKEDKDLTLFINRIHLPISLSKRFENWAKQIQLDGWENDIVDFERFYKIRNQLLHQGDSSIAKTPFATNKDLEELETLTHKYANWALYNKRNINPIIHAGKAIIKAAVNFKIDSSIE